MCFSLVDIHVGEYDPAEYPDQYQFQDILTQSLTILAAQWALFFVQHPCDCWLTPLL